MLIYEFQGVVCVYGLVLGRREAHFLGMGLSPGKIWHRASFSRC
jgi:hypothetical protein